MPIETNNSIADNSILGQLSPLQLKMLQYGVPNAVWGAFAGSIIGSRLAGKKHQVAGPIIGGLAGGGIVAGSALFNAIMDTEFFKKIQKGASLNKNYTSSLKKLAAFNLDKSISATTQSLLDSGLDRAVYGSLVGFLLGDKLSNGSLGGRIVGTLSGGAIAGASNLMGAYMKDLYQQKRLAETIKKKKTI
jgi:uncharacterized protein YcfJ